jgi:hypothetical protein
MLQPFVALFLDCGCKDIGFSCTYQIFCEKNDKNFRISPFLAEIGASEATIPGLDRAVGRGRTGPREGLRDGMAEGKSRFFRQKWGRRVRATEFFRYVCSSEVGRVPAEVKASYHDRKD